MGIVFDQQELLHLADESAFGDREVDLDDLRAVGTYDTTVTDGGDRTANQYGPKSPCLRRQRMSRICLRRIAARC